MSSTEEKPAPIIFDDKELSDVTLVVDNQDFIAHKLILACRSDVFKAMFYGDFKESKEDRVEIKDVSVQNFRRFLEIIYTGKVSDPRNFLEFPMRNNNEHDFCPIGIKRRGYFHNFWNDTTELLNIADRFNATPLVKGYFESIIITTMRICWKESCRQCLNTYIFAILNGMDLSECEKKYVLANYKDWITYATEKPFPDINNKTTNILFRYFV